MKKSTNYQEKSRFDLCDSCMNLFDEKYCKKWRDVVPEETRKNGCEEIDQFPPF